MRRREEMRVIRHANGITYVAPGVLLPHERAQFGRSRPGEDAARRTARAALESALKDADESVRRWQARQAGWRAAHDAGYLLDDKSFAARLAQRGREMYAAAERGDAEYFRRLA